MSILSIGYRMVLPEHPNVLDPINVEIHLWAGFV